MRRLLIAITALAATVAAGVIASPVADAKPVARSQPTYVALGDSYAAGYGLPAPATATRPAVPGCAQTSLDYPRRLASWLHLNLTDVTCSGATTADFYAPQSTPGPHPAAQLDAVKAVQPDLISITIGGNDLGFTPIAQNCLAASANGPIFLHPTFASCSAYFASAGGAASNPIALLPVVEAKVQAAIAAAHAASPRSKIVVIGYPAIAPDARHTPAGGCFTANAIPTTVVGGVPFSSAFPFTNADTPFLASIQQQLDQRIGDAARANGATYVDIYKASLSHSACSPESTRWVEPVVPAGGGTNVLHPSLNGTFAMAAYLIPSALFATLFH
jgi:lysophospholipase L1-like esterase